MYISTHHDESSSVVPGKYKYQIALFIFSKHHDLISTRIFHLKIMVLFSVDLWE